MNRHKWSSPHRVVALALVIVGGLAQIGAVLANDNGDLRAMGLALMFAGVLIELVGHWIGSPQK